MESVGGKLRTERESKDLTIEQIARDTNIAKRYLVALEAEDFGEFPGEPYLIGFLRNYTEYLGLDPDELVELYKNFTIQSQPVPMDELLDTKRSKRPWLVVLIVVVLVGLGIGGYFLYPVVFDGDRRSGSAAEPETPAQNASRYELGDLRLEQRLIEEDVVVVSIAGTTYELTVDQIGDNVTIEIPGGTNVLRIGDERAVDLDGDASMDVRVALTDIDASAIPASAMLRIERYNRETVSESGSSSSESTAEASATVAPAQPTSVEVGEPSIDDRAVPSVNIVTAADIEPFRVSVVFRGYCLVRYLIDGEQREERYFQKGETIALDVSRELRLWISNGGNMLARVEGQDLDLGDPGEVSSRMIAWEYDEAAGHYVLRMSGMY